MREIENARIGEDLMREIEMRELYTGANFTMSKVCIFFSGKTIKCHGLAEKISQSLGEGVGYGEGC